MKKYFCILLVLIIAFSSVSVYATEAKTDKDQKLNIKSSVEFTFTGENDTKISSEDSFETPVLLCFVNLSSDSSYFFLDDINNSEWAGGHTARVIAVDVTGEDGQVLSLIRDGFKESSPSPDKTALELVTDPNLTETAAAFAKEAGLDSDNLSYPFSVILSPQGKLCYALEGYRKPDLLKSYAEAVPASALKLFSYGWKDGIRLFWTEDSTATGYEILKRCAGGEYETVFSTDDNSETSFTDEVSEYRESCSYILRIIYQGGSEDSPDTPTVWIDPNY